MNELASNCQFFVPETHEEMMETAFHAAITVGCMRIAGTTKFKIYIIVKLLKIQDYFLHNIYLENKLF